MSSTARGELWQFYVGIPRIDLTDTEGNSVGVCNDPYNGGLLNPPFCPNIATIPEIQYPGEFLHLDGVSEPLVRTSIPQGTYSSASITISLSSFSIAGVGLDGTAFASTFSGGACSAGPTVQLSSPITVSGSVMALSLDLQVPQSYQFTQSSGSTPATYSTCPVFTLTPLRIAAQPRNDQNGLLMGIDGRVRSVSDGTFTIETALPTGASFSLNTVADTQYQGIPDYSSLAEGMIVNVDAAIQPDGSFVARRVGVDDPTATYMVAGPTLFGSDPETGQFGVLGQEFVDVVSGPGVTIPSWVGVQSDSYSLFTISGEFNNLASLPFNANFGPQTLFAGQRVAVFYSSQATTEYQPVDTITLIPQTINGTVSTVSTSNGFTVYEVNLDSDDLISTLQGQSRNFPDLNNPTQVVVYADGDTQMLTPGAVTIGSVRRFRGLLFDDGGTLRMDCGQILAGATK